MLANVFSNNSSSAARDQIDEVALAEGFVPPDWYVALKDTYAASIGYDRDAASQRPSTPD